MPDFIICNEKSWKHWGFENSEVWISHKTRMKAINSEKQSLLVNFNAKMAETMLKENNIMDAFVTDNPVIAIDKIVVQALPYARIKNLEANDEAGLTEALNNKLIDWKYELTNSYLDGSLTVLEIKELLQVKPDLG
jgi:hypothetical protein